MISPVFMPTKGKVSVNPVTTYMQKQNPHWLMAGGSNTRVLYTDV